jgi:hypothetical protein
VLALDRMPREAAGDAYIGSRWTRHPRSPSVARGLVQPILSSSGWAHYLLHELRVVVTTLRFFPPLIGGNVSNCFEQLER